MMCDQTLIGRPPAVSLQTLALCNHGTQLIILRWEQECPYYT